MNINIDYQNRKPIYEQIVDEIEKYISLGILEANDQIPSIRELALTIGVNPNTVKKAYDILENKGIIVTMSTKGTFVNKDIIKVKEDKIEKEINFIKEKIIILNNLGLTIDEIIEKIKN